MEITQDTLKLFLLITSINLLIIGLTAGVTQLIPIHQKDVACKARGFTYYSIDGMECCEIISEANMVLDKLCERSGNAQDRLDNNKRGFVNNEKTY